LEAGNFWFRSRNQIILWAIRQYAPDFVSFLEVGCGTGYVLSGIAAAYPEAKLYGSELFTEGLRFAAARVPKAQLMQMDAREIPFADEFDVIGAFDVLEHVTEDETALRHMYVACKPDGLLLITVPQHQWLWSPVDEYACHARRYDDAGLRRKVEAAGFHVLRSGSFVTALLPVMALSRYLRRKSKPENANPRAELNVHPWLNSLLYAILTAERACIRVGLNFPIGGSRFLVAQKK
jgi:SAM-dependent methyltransferase